MKRRRAETNRWRRSDHAACLATLVCLGTATVVGAQRRGQGVAYCDLTKVEVQRLSNAVVLRFLSGDGDLHANGEAEVYMDPENDYAGRPLKRIPVSFPNARLRVSSFINVGVYPVSHVELAPASWAREGVGIEAQIVLYRPGVFAGVDFGKQGWDYNRTIEEGIARRGITYDLRLAKTQGGTELTATITSDRQVAQIPDFRREERLSSGVHRLRIAGSAERLSAYAVNVDLRAFLSELSTRTGVPFALDGHVRRAISLNVGGVSAGDLLAALSRAYGLSSEVRGDTVFVTDAAHDQRTAYDQFELAVVPLRYLEPEEAALLLPDSVLPYLRPDAGHSALSVAGPEWLVNKVRRDLARLDQRPELIELELLVAELQRSDLEEIGFRASHTTGTSTWNFDVEGGDLSFESTGRLARDWELRLDALEQSGRGRTQARVVETVRAGHEARLFAGQTKYLMVHRNDRRQGTVGHALPVEVGAELLAQPVTSGEGPIQVGLHAKVSNIVGEDPVTRMPELSTREVRSTVRIDDGETIVLSSSVLTQDATERRPLGAPAAPGARYQEDRRRELFLFLTARVVTDRPAVSAPLAAAMETGEQDQPKRPNRPAL